ncbi:hypothetical protein B0H19DRAFT_185374 [Mycena capillaripes]|nr:hypothetical protein B0H19DRAFT_185374 [Mycena capillaripes]
MASALSTSGIYVRQYRVSDFSQIRALLFEGIRTSKGKITPVAKRRFVFPPYTFFGILVGYFLGSIYAPEAGGLMGAVTMMSAAGLAILEARKRALPEAIYAHKENALKTDMGDILAHYRAPSAFFVAVRPREVADVEAGRDELDGDEVVGYVGLQHLPEKDPQTAEVRHFIVPERYRSHGVAKHLMCTLLAHAAAIPGLLWLELRSIEFPYAPGTQPLYNWSGWEVVKIERLSGDDLRGATFYHIRRPMGQGRVKDQDLMTDEEDQEHCRALEVKPTPPLH